MSPLLCTQTDYKSLFLFTTSLGRGGVWDLREASRIHFHLSFYLSDFVVPSYGQKHSRGCYSVYGSPEQCRNQRKQIMRTNQTDQECIRWSTYFHYICFYYFCLSAPLCRSMPQKSWWTPLNLIETWPWSDHSSEALDICLDEEELVILFDKCAKGKSHLRIDKFARVVRYDAQR